MKVKRTIQILQALARGDSHKVTPGQAKVALEELRSKSLQLSPTPRSLAILVKLKQMTDLAGGLAPTQRALGDALGIAAPTVCQHFDTLEERGCIVRAQAGHTGNVMLTERGLSFISARSRSESRPTL